MEDRENMGYIITEGRLALQSLCAHASRSVAENSRAGIQPGSFTGTLPGTSIRRMSRSRTPTVETESSRYGVALGPHSGQPGSRPGTRASSRATSSTSATSSIIAPVTSSSELAHREHAVPAVRTQSTGCLQNIENNNDNTQAKDKKLSKVVQKPVDKKRREEQYAMNAKKPNVPYRSAFRNGRARIWYAR